ncbi:hypothetical protein BC833DRAFT_572089 [Globomyces pollinis-pini]|nr:hypothetical protein BC833DRAFT_572089 [Globomyces pollinis-pini]
MQDQIDELYNLLESTNTSDLHEALSLLKLSNYLHSHALLDQDLLYPIESILLDVYPINQIGLDMVNEFVMERIGDEEMERKSNISCLVQKRNIILLVKHPIRILNILYQLLKSIQNDCDWVPEHLKTITLLINILYTITTQLNGLMEFQKNIYRLSIQLYNRLSIEMYTGQLKLDTDLMNLIMKLCLKIGESDQLNKYINRLVDVFSVIPDRDQLIVDMDEDMLTLIDPIGDIKQNLDIDSIHEWSEYFIKCIEGLMIHNHDCIQFNHQIIKKLFNLYIRLNSIYTTINTSGQMFINKPNKIKQLSVSLERQLHRYILKGNENILIDLLVDLNIYQQNRSTSSIQSDLEWFHVCDLLVYMMNQYQDRNGLSQKSKTLQTSFQTITNQYIDTMIRCVYAFDHQSCISVDIVELVVGSISDSIVKIFMKSQHLCFIPKLVTTLSTCYPELLNSNAPLLPDLLKPAIPSIGTTWSITNARSGSSTPPMTLYLTQILYRIFSTLHSMFVSYYDDMFGLNRCQSALDFFEISKPTLERHHTTSNITQSSQIALGEILKQVYPDLLKSITILSNNCPEELKILVDIIKNVKESLNELKPKPKISDIKLSNSVIEKLNRPLKSNRLELDPLMNIPFPKPSPPLVAPPAGGLPPRRKFH